jgi:hypothetical protein
VKGRFEEGTYEPRPEQLKVLRRIYKEGHVDLKKGPMNRGQSSLRC